MAYKLNKKWFQNNGCEEVVLKHTRVDFCYRGVIESVSNNQAILEELYEMGKDYVTCGLKNCDVDKKCCNKNIESDGIKEAPVKKEKKQVSTKTSKKK